MFRLTIAKTNLCLFAAHGVFKSTIRSAQTIRGSVGMGYQIRSTNQNAEVRKLEEKDITTPSSKDEDFEKDYFTSNGYPSVWGHKIMLDDEVRMKSYHSAIMQNKSLFEGKTVLDIGTGTGVLSLWAAQAGAKKVYAIDYTNIAEQARKLVAANGMSDVIEVFQGAAEDLNLPCKVDIIISEWMGYLLLKESMFDSVLVARDRFLKPDGSMFPSHGTIHMAAISQNDEREARLKKYQDELADWDKFNKEMVTKWGINYSALLPAFKREQRDYHISSSLLTHLKPDEIVGDAILAKSLDMKTCKLIDVQGLDLTQFEITAKQPATVTGLAGWFTTDFRGSAENPAPHPVTLSTGPEHPYTHWGQQAFYFEKAMEVKTGSKVHGTFAMPRCVDNKRMYEMHVEVKVDDKPDVVKEIYFIP